MSDLTLRNLDPVLVDLLASRSAATGRPAEDLAKEALLKGLLWSPAERAAYARGVRDLSPTLREDSTDEIRRMRDSA